MRIAAVNPRSPSRLAVTIDREDALGNPLAVVVLTDERWVLQPPVALSRLLASGWVEYAWDRTLGELLEAVPALGDFAPGPGRGTPGWTPGGS